MNYWLLLLIIPSYIAGLCSAIFFVWGFQAHKRVVSGGRLIGREPEVEILDPIVNTGRREEELEEEVETQDAWRVGADR